MNSELEQAYIDSLTRQVFPGPEMEVAGTVRPGAMQGEMKAIEQSPVEALMEKTGATLEEIGMALDGLGKVSIGGIELGIRDFLPFVGGSEKELDPLTGEQRVVQVGTPEALQKAGRGESLVRGTGFATQLVPDAKLAAFDVPTAGALVKSTAKVAGNVGRDIGREMATTPPTGAVQLAPSQPLPNVVSTRMPTAVKATEDPLAENLISDFATMKRDPAAFEHNLGLVREYPNFVSRARNPERRAEDFIQHVEDNLLYLYDKVPEATRNRSRLWYEGARNIVDRWGNEYGQPDQAVSGVLAVLSPQTDWFVNVSRGKRVLDIAMTQGDKPWDDAMEVVSQRIYTSPENQAVLALVRGKSYNQLDTKGKKALWLRAFDEAYNDRSHNIISPEGGFMDVRLKQDGSPYGTAWGSLNEIAKAISIIDDPTRENVSARLGKAHKVRNFYNNIYAPNDPSGHVTIDTHAVAAGLMRPLSGNSREVSHNFGTNVKGERGPANSSVTGAQGTYGLYAEAYRRAAAKRGVLPREMQSITWEAVRGLFPDTYKTAENTQQIDGIWLRYRRGQLSLEEARNAVIESAGGINAPEWERAGLRSGAAGGGGSAINAGELPGPGVSRRGARGPGREQPAARNTSTVKGAGKAPAKGAE